MAEINQEHRKDALRALIGKTNIDTGRNYSGAEDVLAYLNGKDAIHRWASVTVTGGDSSDEFVYIRCDWDTADQAMLFAIDNIRNDIYSEFPWMVVDLDTGHIMRPSWDEMPWRTDDVIK